MNINSMDDGDAAALAASSAATATKSIRAISASPRSINIESNKDFCRISMETKRIIEARDRLVIDAFDALELHHALLAKMLVLRLGERMKAARWMCSHQKPFDGRTAYDLISDGDVETVWDAVERASRQD
ncbi:MAG TPA: hypothetical protein VME63_17395 [Dyella sp.]|uniref:hypothetical protein n=1 Tax=Dyella sp. TaxID=1869338 RepID=UPI002CD2A877|nr:hypothetical protein [Dyella sp.]HTV87177.1 hypothetical protein [Dyella sp.]